MKKITTALALMLLTSTAPAFAGNVVAEIRAADIRSGYQNSTEYKFEFNDTAGGLLYGAELQARQQAHQGPLDSKISVRGGVDIPEVFGFRPVAYAEVGKSLSVGRDGYFWGVNAGLSRDIFGPVSANVGVRRRQTFDFVQTGKFVEDRANVGVRYAVSKDTAIGVQYYNYLGNVLGGNVNRQEVGLQLVRSF